MKNNTFCLDAAGKKLPDPRAGQSKNLTAGPANVK
jgi:hypothetical protein